MIRSNITRGKNRKTITNKRYIGGTKNYTLNIINHYYNDTYNKHFPDDRRDAVNGEFVVHKEFQVKLNTSPRKKKIFGYIIQKVEKNTEAYTNKNSIKNSIKNISKFTSDYVRYMNDSYYELFFVIDGESTSGDNFQNGAILEYTFNNSNGSYGPDDRTNTSGAIDIKGTSWFIPSTENEVKNNNYMVNSATNNNSNKSIEILGIIWSLSQNTPANGLPFISIKNGKNVEKLQSDSNIVLHIVEVKWNTLEKINGISESFTKSIFK